MKKVLIVFFIVNVLFSVSYAEEKDIGGDIVLSIYWGLTASTTEFIEPSVSSAAVLGKYTFFVDVNENVYIYDITGQRVVKNNPPGKYEKQWAITSYAWGYDFCIDSKDQLYFLYKKIDLGGNKIGTFINRYGKDSEYVSVSKLIDNTTDFYRLNIDNQDNVWYEDNGYKYDLYKNYKLVNTKLRAATREKINLPKHPAPQDKTEEFIKYDTIGNSYFKQTTLQSYKEEVVCYNANGNVIKTILLTEFLGKYSNLIKTNVRVNDSGAVFYLDITQSGVAVKKYKIK